jgi:sec-independent protein translocase protein TatA
MPSFGHSWVIIILALVIVLVVFGPGKLPQIGGAAGAAIRDFRRAVKNEPSEATRSSHPLAEAPQPTDASSDCHSSPTRRWQLETD